jgi:hypothetical protein
MRHSILPPHAFDLSARHVFDEENVMAEKPAAPDTHDKPRAPGGNNLSNIDPAEADRVIPRPGEAMEPDPLHDPDKIGTTPDDSGNRPRPL